MSPAEACSTATARVSRRTSTSSTIAKPAWPPLPLSTRPCFKKRGSASSGFIVSPACTPRSSGVTKKRPASNGARDSDFRFFATMRDALFGYRLHLVDLATSKMLAAAGRREPRDVLDLLHIHDHHLSLGAVVWASVAKDPGFSPESLIAEVRRNACYRADDFADLGLSRPIDAGDVSRRLKASLADAERFVAAMPAGQEGLVFLGARESGPARPGDARGLRDPRRPPARALAVLARHRRGHDRARSGQGRMTVYSFERAAIASAAAISSGLLMLRNGSTGATGQSA